MIAKQRALVRMIVLGLIDRPVSMMIKRGTAILNALILILEILDVLQVLIITKRIKIAQQAGVGHAAKIALIKNVWTRVGTGSGWISAVIRILVYLRPQIIEAHAKISPGWFPIGVLVNGDWIQFKRMILR